MRLKSTANKKASVIILPDMTLAITCCWPSVVPNYTLRRRFLRCAISASSDMTRRSKAMYASCERAGPERES